jgi:histidine phosphotransferase ChpT
MFTDDKTQLAWSAPQALYPKNKVKLILNLVVIAQSAIPRGGLIDVTVKGDGEAPTIVITAKGSHARIPPHVEALIAGTPEGGTVDAHAILPFYAGLVARAAQMDVTFAITGDQVTIGAVPTPQAGTGPAPEEARPSDEEPPETALA